MHLFATVNQALIPALPESEDVTCLNWLGEQISEHHLYGYAMARLIHGALVRDETYATV